MTKIDFTDITFCIPFCKDSNQRIENLNTICEYIDHYFDTHIIIGEQYLAKTPHLFADRPNVNNLTVEFFHDFNESFHRTKILNRLYDLCETPIIVNYDCDVLFDVEQYQDSVNAIRTNIADVVSPFTGKFYDIPLSYIKEIKKYENRLLDIIDITKCRCRNPNSYGGAIFFNRDSLIKGGMENENFIAWGPEDLERFDRFKKLGFRMYRLKDSYCYHLTHPKGKNSSSSNPMFKHNNEEYNKVKNMTKDQLKNYMLSWKWLNKYNDLRIDRASSYPNKFKDF